MQCFHYAIALGRYLFTICQSIRMFVYYTPYITSGLFKTLICHMSVYFQVCMSQTNEKLYRALRTEYRVPSTAYRVQRTEYSVQSTAYRVQRTEYSVQSTAYRVQRTEFSVPSTAYRVQSTEYRVQSTEYSVHSTAYRVQRTQYSVQSTAYIVQRTEYSVPSTAYRVQRTEYSVQRTKYSVPSTAYRVQRTEYSVQSTAYRVRSTEYRVLDIECYYGVLLTTYSIEMMIYGTVLSHIVQCTGHIGSHYRLAVQSVWGATTNVGLYYLYGVPLLTQGYTIYMGCHY